MASSVQSERTAVDTSSAQIDPILEPVGHVASQLKPLVDGLLGRAVSDHLRVLGRVGPTPGSFSGNAAVHLARCVTATAVDAQRTRARPRVRLRRHRARGKHLRGGHLAPRRQAGNWFAVAEDAAQGHRRGTAASARWAVRWNHRPRKPGSAGGATRCAATPGRSRITTTSATTSTAWCSGPA